MSNYVTFPDPKRKPGQPSIQTLRGQPVIVKVLVPTVQTYVPIDE